MICHLALAKMSHCGAKVAQFLGVTFSSGNWLASSEGMADLKKYLNAFWNLRPPSPLITTPFRIF